MRPCRTGGGNVPLWNGESFSKIYIFSTLISIKGHSVMSCGARELGDESFCQKCCLVYASLYRQGRTFLPSLPHNHWCSFIDAKGVCTLIRGKIYSYYAKLSIELVLLYQLWCWLMINQVNTLCALVSCSCSLEGVKMRVFFEQPL